MKRKKNDPDDIEWLVAVYQGQKVEESLVPHKCRWILKMTQDEARDELIFRFRPLAASLVGLCLSGKRSPRSSFQKKFLQMFVKSGETIDSVGFKIASCLSTTDRKELFLIAEECILEAARGTRKNLASTIVIKFYEAISEMIKDPLMSSSIEMEDLDSDYEVLVDEQKVVDIISLNIGLDSLSAAERTEVDRFLAGEIPDIPERIKRKLRTYLEDL